MAFCSSILHVFVFRTLAIPYQAQDYGFACHVGVQVSEHLRSLTARWTVLFFFFFFFSLDPLNRLCSFLFPHGQHLIYDGCSSGSIPSGHHSLISLHLLPQINLTIASSVELS